MLRKNLAVIALVAFAPSAHAFIDPPYITPQHPTAGEEIFINIRAGVCDGIGSISGYPQVIRSGNDIRIVLWSDSFTDPILCNFPVGTSTYSIGEYGPGVYSLQVDRQYFGTFGETLSETLGVIPFAIAGGGTQPVALPTSNTVSLIVLGFVLFVVALTKLHCSFLPRMTDRQSSGYAR